jgi:hypothetical protein
MKTLAARVSTRSSPKSNKDTNSRLGNYEILEEITRSRMGVIFSARQRHFRRIVVAKRVLVYHGDSPRKNARATSARNPNGRKAGSSQHPALGRIFDIRSARS